MTWATFEANLRRWHAARDQDALGSSLTFVETELRLMMPPVVQRAWIPQDIEDALSDFLLKLMKKPLPEGIADPRSYVARAFRNHCIDRHEARRRRREISDQEMAAGWEPAAKNHESSTDVVDDRDQAQALRAALQKLTIADRVVLKLELAPEWLDDEEAIWLASRSGQNLTHVRQAAASAEGMFELTRVFDPTDDDPRDRDARRKRMERFRRRRARAKEKLRELLPEVP